MSPDRTAYTASRPGEKELATEKRWNWEPFANITETTVNKGFGEVHNGHSSQKSPTNSTDEVY